MTNCIAIATAACVGAFLLCWGMHLLCRAIEKRNIPQWLANFLGFLQLLMVPLAIIDVLALFMFIVIYMIYCFARLWIYLYGF